MINTNKLIIINPPCPPLIVAPRTHPPITGWVGDRTAWPHAAINRPLTSPSPTYVDRWPSSAERHPRRSSDTNRSDWTNQQHRPNQLKRLMSVLYNTDTAIKERLKTGRGYRVESCGLWCHGLLVFKQHLVSIKTAFMSASVDRKCWWRDDLLNQDFTQTSGGQWDCLPLPKNTCDFTSSFFLFFSNAEKMHK